MFSKGILGKRFFKEFVHLAVPVMILAVLNATLGIADVMMVGGLGSDAVAGVGLAAKMHFLTILVMLGFAIAGRVLVTQYYGAKQHDKIKQSLVLTLSTSIIMISPFALLFAISPEWWLQYISDDSGIVAIAAKYLQITAIIVILSAVNLSFEISLRAVGFVKAPLYLGASSALLNIFLNYVFIFGHFGAPELGAEGAAWGSLFARAIQFVILATYLYSTKNMLAPRLTDLVILRDMSKWKHFFSYATPVVLTFLLFGVGNSLYYVISGRMGAEALTVISIISPIESLVIGLFVGYGEAVSILVGRALGAEKYRFAWLLQKITSRYGIVLAAIFGMILWLLQDLVLKPFDALSTDIQHTTDLTYFFLCALIWVKVQNMIIIMGVLRAGGDNKWCLKLEIASLWAVGIPATAIGGLVIGLDFHWVFLLMSLESVAKLIASEWRVRKKVWLKNLTHVLG